MPSMKQLMAACACVWLAQAASLPARPAPDDDRQSAARPAAQAAAPAAQTAPVPVAVYKSRHGFSVEYPKGWILQAVVEEDAALGTGIANPSFFHLYDYDPERADNPGEPVPPDKLKIEVLVARRAFGSYDEWLKTIPRVRTVKDFPTGAGPGKEVVNVEADLENGGTFVSRRVILLTPSLELDFHYYPVDSKARAAFDRVVASFRETK